MIAVAKVRDIYLKEPDIEEIMRDLYEGKTSVGRKDSEGIATWPKDKDVV